jgi:hypothetical protein
MLCKSLHVYALPMLMVAGSGSLWAVGACGTLPPATAHDFQASLQAFLDNKCYQSSGWRHDPDIRGTNGVHPNVKVWYSPGMWAWMTGGRHGDAPEGGILVKEQYGDTPSPTLLTDWAVMIRDKEGSWDGWWWGDLSAPSTVTTPLPPPLTSGPNCTQAQYPYAAFGEYCINCHASAANGQGTFATTRFVLGYPGPTLTHFPPDDNIHFHLAHRAPVAGTESNDAACLVPESSDHVVAGSPPDGPRTFLTSDQCTGCHNATGTLSPARADLPSMLYYLNGSSPTHDPKTVNLSPNGEWRFSMMGLAGRDPIFFSQLNSETTIHSNLKLNDTPAKPFVENLCLHCHGVMGQRQFEHDTGKLFTRAQMQDPDSLYGALARDGISCTVCHRIEPEGLGTKATYTGNFRVGAPDHVYGPFKDPLKLPMKNALGVKPLEGQQITESTLCGSCHTIILPVFRASGEPVMETVAGKREQKTFIEQATFFEWLNSKFADNGSAPESCQQCHMPDSFLHDGQESDPLAYKIANIEDNTFPPVDHRAPDKEITLQKRSGYRRHLLLGINLFALEMFKQFRTELGLYTPDPQQGVLNPDPMIRQSLNTEDGLDTAIDQGTNLIAKTKTADVKILCVVRRRDAWQVDVQVTNKAGHSFPSGVGFRRAFLNFQVLTEADEVLWASGNIAPANSGALNGLKGVIVNGQGAPLLTETFTPSQQHFQPHYWGRNPITREDQVQIYEELVRNPEGFLTTSFLALNQKAKDNRLQPQGWSSTGPEAAETAPVGTCVATHQRAGRERFACDPHYEDGSGSSVVRYLVPITKRTALADKVRATLYYQTIPPYYQLQRATDATGVDTERLVRFVNKLDVAGTPVDKWVLKIAGDEVEVETSHPDQRGGRQLITAYGQPTR